MTNLNHKYGQPLIFNSAKDSIVSDPIAPEVGALMLKTLPKVARVVCVRNALMKVAKDATLNGFVEPSKVVFRFVGKCD